MKEPLYYPITGNIIPADWMPRDTIWLINGDQHLMIKNIAAPEPLPLKIGDWPWPERK